MSTHPLTAYRKHQTKGSAAQARDGARGRRPAALLTWLQKRVPDKALVDFLRSFAVMVKARLSLVQALDSVGAQTQHRALAQIIGDVSADLQRGRSLSESMARHPQVFDATLVHLIRVGELAGILDEILIKMAAHREKMATLKRRIQLALLYPAMVLAVAVGATAFLLISVVPTFAEMYQDFGSELPVPTQVVLDLSNFAVEHAGLILLGLCGVALALGLYKQSTQGRALWDRLVLRIPLLGRLLVKSLTARFCRTLGTLLTSGVTLLEALDIIAGSSTNVMMQREIAEMSKAVRRGNSLHQTLQAARILPTMLVQMMAVGEATAELDTMLLHAAEYYEGEVDTFVDGLTALVEPILIVIIGVLLGGILAALYLPMFDMVTVVG
ncbi:MAG: type II secretion system F family protein [Verrucomicrobiota bacterium]